MMISTLRNLDNEMVREIADQDAALLKLLQNGTRVAVLAIVVDNGSGDLTDNYYDIAFADGTMCCAISGHHLEGIASWK